MNMQKEKNWFDKNPRKTLLGIFIVISLILIFSTEYILSKKAINKGFNHGIKRYIRLKEHNPYFSHMVIPSQHNNIEAVTLTKKIYPLNIDKNGFIKPSNIHEEPDLKIVFLGGSTTECRFVEEENRFPYLVGRLIESDIELNVNSYNSGVSGNDSIHSINILLNKVLPMKPDIVVMMHNVNDLSTLTLEKSYWNHNPTRSVIIVSDDPFVESIRKIKNTLIPNLYAALIEIFQGSNRPGEFDHIKGQKIQLDKEYLLDEFKKNLLMFISINKIRNITPVLMTQANRLKTKPDKIIKEQSTPLINDYQIMYEEYKEIYDQFNQAIRDIGKQNDVLVIDLAKIVPQEKEYMYDMAHYNDNGSKYVAYYIKEQLVKLINAAN